MSLYLYKQSWKNIETNFCAKNGVSGACWPLIAINWNLLVKLVRKIRTVLFHWNQQWHSSKARTKTDSHVDLCCICHTPVEFAVSCRHLQWDRWTDAHCPQAVQSSNDTLPRPRTVDLGHLVSTTLLSIDQLCDTSCQSATSHCEWMWVHLHDLKICQTTL